MSEDTILIWQVSPGRDGFDSTIFDNEKDAGTFAARKAHYSWDDRFEHEGEPPDPSPLQPGPAVTIQCYEMLRSEFEELERG